MRSAVTLTFICPATKHNLEYRVAVDARTLVKSWSKTLRCRCPYCKSVHSFSFRTGYVDGMIAHIGQIEGDPAASLLAR